MFCFRWIFGTNSTYTAQLKQKKILPLAFQFELNVFIAFNSLLLGRSNLDISNSVSINWKNGKRRSTANPITVIGQHQTLILRSSEQPTSTSFYIGTV